MQVEYRLILTATFNTSAPRNACFNALKAQVQAYAAAHPADLKRADMTKDSYQVPEVDEGNPEKVV